MDDQPPVSQPVSETLPAQYRAVLDRVADLESSGRRHEADDVRRAAIQAYSRVWTAATARRLDSLAARADRLMTLAPSERRARARFGFAWLATERLASLSRRQANPAISTPVPASPPSPEPPSA